jgi:hypothetical protein
MTAAGESEDTEELAAGPTCSTWAREAGIDPIGTAGSYRGYLLVEWPLPWPRDMAEVPALAPVAEAARSAAMRLQGLVPAAGSGPVHVAAYRWPDRGACFERAELEVAPGEQAEAALAVLGEPARRSDMIDVLVCTHGRRDRCCGSLGTSLAQQLSPPALGEGVRLWRTSHTGGHRFAPTAIVLPYGTAWAFCDREALEKIVHREGPLEDLLPRYRGCSGLGSSAVQALERAVLAELGWELFDMPRRGEDLGEDRVALTVEHPDGTTSVWEALVRGESRPVPDCGRPVELATKHEPQWSLRDLRRR